MKLFSALILSLPLFSRALKNERRSLKKGKKGSTPTLTGCNESSRALKGASKKAKKAGKSTLGAGTSDMNFNRVGTFLSCYQLDPTCNVDTQTVAEILTVSKDGMTIIYTDSAREVLGFVDIKDPSSPIALGTVDLPGEPTSVATWGDYALVAVNTSDDYINTSGLLIAVHIESQKIQKQWNIGGQPDSIAVSKDGRFAVIAIENERDEDLGDGVLPQMPPGFVVVVDTSSSDLNQWAANVVDVTGLDGASWSEDPEPEYVSINSNNIATVTLQENNAVVLIDLETLSVVRSFSAGSVDLMNIDTVEEDLIDQSSSLSDVPREPDGVTWISNTYFATANEGDMFGGSRGFTVWDTCGNVVFDSGSQLEHITAAVGHYPEGRSENKGAEPENVAFGTFGKEDLLFINMERSSTVAIYDVSDPEDPIFKQILPCNVGPEGGLAIPHRNLYIVAQEEDDRDANIRGGVTIYEYSKGKATYPTIHSMIPDDGSAPIAWAALSGLTASKKEKNSLFAVEDSAFIKSRILKLDVSKSPAIITEAISIKDTNGVFASFEPYGDFSAEDLAAMINDDLTVNIDSEGITEDSDGNFWIVSEGSGTVGEASRPIKSLNFLFHVTREGVIAKVVSLPDALNDVQVRYGFEGVAFVPENGGYVVCILQRAWPGYAEHPLVGVYSIGDDEWIGAVQYPLDEPESQFDGSWVGLSDISYVGDGKFFILERDNRGGPDAAIKRIYQIDLSSSDLMEEVVEKTLIADLISAYDSTGGLVPEKLEGMAVVGKKIWIVNDNDGVDDNSGETQLISIKY